MADEALERHRVRYRMNGFPIYDEDEGDEPIGVIVEPIWDWESMTEAQRVELREVASYLQDAGQMTDDQAFSYALGEFGIQCPHDWVNTEPIYRECRWCRMVEQLPGIVVRIDGREMRVSDPPPSRLRIPRPAEPTALMVRDDDVPTSTIDVDEYEWNPHARRYIASR